MIPSLHVPALYFVCNVNLYLVRPCMQPCLYTPPPLPWGGCSFVSVSPLVSHSCLCLLLLFLPYLVFLFSSLVPMQSHPITVSVLPFLVMFLSFSQL